MLNKSSATSIVAQNKSLSQTELTPEQVDLIKKTVAVGATNDELQLFLYTAKRTGLDPLAKQIHFVKRAGRMTIQTGIDGYRAVAERSGRLAGISDATFDSEDGPHPKKATVAVRKLVGPEKIVEFVASARWNEYKPSGPQAFMWDKMPYLMLGKCAEALALRKAFPQDLSGLYTDEEMAQASNTKATLPEKPAKAKPAETDWPDEIKVEADANRNAEVEKMFENDLQTAKTAEVLFATADAISNSTLVEESKARLRELFKKQKDALVK